MIITYRRFCAHRRKDLSLKNCKTDIILITGMLSPYASVVEKLYRELDKNKATLLRVERAGDVLLDTVSAFPVVFSHSMKNWWWLILSELKGWK